MPVPSENPRHEVVNIHESPQRFTTKSVSVSQRQLCIIFFSKRRTVFIRTSSKRWTIGAKVRVLAPTAAPSQGTRFVMFGLVSSGTGLEILMNEALRYIC
jgi:hypothetical protein